MVHRLGRTGSQYLRQSPAPLRIVAFLGALVLLALPVAGPLHWLDMQQPEVHWGIAVLLTLAASFLLLVGPWLRRIHHIPHPWQRLGWGWRGWWWRGWSQGWALGAVGVAGLYGWQVGLGWGQWQGLTLAIIPLALEGALMATVVGWAEELVFRGWLLFELEVDYAPAIALGINSLLFALAHYIRPWDVILATWPQFIGLLLLGVTLGWARRSPMVGRRGRLLLGGAQAFPAGLHGGLVWGYYLVQVGGLVVTTNRVPPWVTGVEGNPLAGAMGVLLLGAIALIFYRRSRSYQPGLKA